MYAIVEIAGQQFKVEKEQEIFVHRLQEDAGSVVEFDEVMLLDNEGKVSVGTPTVDGALVKAKIVEHMKADKVIVFHKKRRKGYQKQNGHRQFMSKILIEDILTNAKKAVTKAAPKKEEVKAEAKVEAKAQAAKPKAAPNAKAETKDAPAKEVKKAAPKAEAKTAKPKTEAKAKEAKPAAKKATPKAKEEKKDDQ
jgi:large subunit ribosomal protein L21